MIKKKLSELFQGEARDMAIAFAASAVICTVLVTTLYVLVLGKTDYFTTLNYTDYNSLPKFISEGKEYTYTVVLGNREKASVVYDLRVVVRMDNSSKEIFKKMIEVSKNEKVDIPLTFKLDAFERAEIVTRLANRDPEIKFQVYNEELIVAYPDGVAFVDCLKNVSIAPSDFFTIRAKGDLGPNMKVRVDGAEIYSTVVDSKDYQDYRVDNPIGTGILDIVFDNDYYNAATGDDRNLRIESITIGNRKIPYTQMLVDLGKNMGAFDCINLKDASPDLNSNGALRLRTVAR